MKCYNEKHSLSGILKLIIYVIVIIIILNFIIKNSSIYYRKTIYLPFSLHLNKHDIVLFIGEEYKLYVYGINKRVSFSSSNFKVASVNINGKIYAIQPGKAIIKAKVDNKVLKCRVRVIDLRKKKLVLTKGNSYRLKVRGILTFPRWKSSNNSIATVNMFGKVKAKNKGSTVITAKVKGKNLRCIVTVK